MNYSLTIKGVTIAVRTMKTAKNLTLRSKADGITLTVPFRCDKATILSFVNANIDKAMESMYKLQQERTNVVKPITEYKTRCHTLRFIQTPATVVKCYVTKDEIKVFYPKKLDIADPKVQSIAKEGIKVALKAEATAYIPQRLTLLAEKNGLKFSGVKINSARGRWGSCSTNKTINISCYTIMLPDELIDLVLLHELAHTVHMNHGEKFHALVDKLTGGKEKILEKQLKEYHI